MTELLLNFDATECEVAEKAIRIEFDGGTPSNCPKIGYGIGYGSYRIGDGPVVRVSHGRAMSANAAEIFTLICAVQAVIAEHGRNGNRLEIIGDSKIALKWARARTEGGRLAKMSKGTSVEFRNAVQGLRDALKGFRVTATWQPRLKSVETFGH